MAKQQRIKVTHGRKGQGTEYDEYTPRMPKVVVQKIGEHWFLGVTHVDGTSQIAKYYNDREEARRVAKRLAQAYLGAAARGVTGHVLLAKAAAEGRLDEPEPAWTPCTPPAFPLPPEAVGPEEYAAQGGGACPICHSGDLSGHSFDSEGAFVWQNVDCLDCQASFQDVYMLKGYDYLELPEPAKEAGHA